MRLSMKEKVRKYFDTYPDDDIFTLEIAEYFDVPEIVIEEALDDLLEEGYIEETPESEKVEQ